MVDRPLLSTRDRRSNPAGPRLRCPRARPKGNRGDQQTAADLKLDTRYQARVRLTGPVPIQDEEFATLKENAARNTIATLVAILFILWLALKSPKIILAVFVSIAVGLLKMILGD